MTEPPGAQAILVLQHIGCEPPAAYEDELLQRGFSVRRVHLDEGDELPDWREYGGVVAMGGPMGAYDEAIHPWLGPEKRLIAEAATAGKPVWGVCLGAQLLAASLGADVAPGALPEVGVLPVELTAAAAQDPVFSAAPAEFAAFHWHGDTYELPPGAVQLARSEQYEQQAFVFRNAYALQFHLEVSPELVAEWGRVPAYAHSLDQLERPVGICELVDEVTAAQSGSIALARELFGHWLDLIA
jgi:GMP synthase (glutamine-hydrolysing)